MSRADRGIEFYDFNTNRQLICGVGGNPGDCGVHVSPLLFAPRIGIAWRPLETLVIRTGFSLNWQQDLMYRNGLYSYPTQITQTQTGIDSYRAVSSLSDGFPAVIPVDISSGSVRLPSGSGITTLPNDFVRGYIMSWNFTVQKSLAHNLTAQAGYVGTRGVKLLWNQNVNYGLPGGGAASQPFFRTLGITAGMNILLPMNHTTYDSLQASLTRRFSAGLQLNAGYTFSKAIAAFAGNIPIPQYFNLNRGLQGGATTTASLAQVGDVPHKFTLSAVQELPFGKGKRYFSHRGFVSALAGGWQVNLLFSSISGTPFSVSASTVSLNAPGSPQRADQVKSNVAILGGAGPGQPWFDPLAFASVNDPRFGTGGFNTVRGPGLVNLDAGLFRQFRLTERFQLQFRAEGFNVTNTPHFANPSGTNVSNMQLNPDGTIRNLNGFGLITSTRATGRDFDERYFRLGLRLSW